MKVYHGLMVLLLFRRPIKATCQVTEQEVFIKIFIMIIHPYVAYLSTITLYLMLPVWIITGIWISGKQLTAFHSEAFKQRLLREIFMKVASGATTSRNLYRAAELINVPLFNVFCREDMPAPYVN